MATVIIGIAVLFFLEHGLSWFFEKTKIPDLLIIVAIGYALGPLSGIIDPSDLGKVGGVVATTALIVILYEGGLHLSTRDLLVSSLPALSITTVGFFLVTGAITLICYTFAMQSWSTSLLVAMGLGSTSSAIVIPMVKQLSITDKTKTILGLESAFTDVIAIVIFLLLVDSFAAGTFRPMELIVGLGPKTVLAGLMGIFSGFIWAYIKKNYSRMVNMAFAGEAWALLTYGIIEATHHNGAIGVLTLGFMLANLNLFPDWLKNKVSTIPVTPGDMSLLSEITFLLRGLFFLYLGLLIKFSDWTVVILALFISIIIFMTRYFAVKLLFNPEKYSQLDAMVTTAMGPRGLACAVLATIPLQRGLNDAQWIQDVIFAVIPITILLTAIFVALSENKKFRSYFKKLFQNYPDAAPQPTVPIEEK